MAEGRRTIGLQGGELLRVTVHDGIVVVEALERLELRLRGRGRRRDRSRLDIVLLVIRVVRVTALQVRISWSAEMGVDAQARSWGRGEESSRCSCRTEGGRKRVGQPSATIARDPRDLQRTDLVVLVHSCERREVAKRQSTLEVSSTSFRKREQREASQHPRPRPTTLHPTVQKPSCPASTTRPCAEYAASILVTASRALSLALSLTPYHSSTGASTDSDSAPALSEGSLPRPRPDRREGQGAPHARPHRPPARPGPERGGR